MECKSEAATEEKVESTKQDVKLSVKELLPIQRLQNIEPESNSFMKTPTYERASSNDPDKQPVYDYSLDKSERRNYASNHHGRPQNARFSTTILPKTEFTTKLPAYDYSSDKSLPDNYPASSLSMTGEWPMSGDLSMTLSSPKIFAKTLERNHKFGNGDKESGTCPRPVWQTSLGRSRRTSAAGTFPARIVQSTDVSLPPNELQPKHMKEVGEIKEKRSLYEKFISSLK